MGKRWSRQDDLYLLDRYATGEGIFTIAEVLGRSYLAVMRRIQRLRAIVDVVAIRAQRYRKLSQQQEELQDD